MSNQSQQRTQPQTRPPTSRKDDEEDDGEEDVEELDPDSIVTLTIMDRHNAGKKPATRWGKVQFDEIGEATIKVPVRDIHIVHQLKWLSEEDQKRYLHLEKAAPPTVAENVASAELEAARGASARLAQKNAELEEKLDNQAAKFKTEFKAYQEGTQKEIETLRAKRKEAEDALAAAMKELTALKAEMPSAKASKAAK